MQCMPQAKKLIYIAFVFVVVVVASGFVAVVAFNSSP